MPIKHGKWSQAGVPHKGWMYLGVEDTGLPPEHVAKLFADTQWALHAPDVTDKLVAQGWDVLGSPPADFAAVLRSELEKWSTVVKGAKIKEN